MRRFLVDSVPDTFVLRFLTPLFYPVLVNSCLPYSIFFPPGFVKYTKRDLTLFLRFWLAGADIKRGIQGATDELGFHVLEHPHYVTDLHATVY